MWDPLGSDAVTPVPSSLPQAWLDRLFLETLPRLISFRCNEISALLFALADGQVQPPRQWMTACLAATYARMGSFSSQVSARSRFRGAGHPGGAAG